MRKSVPNGSPVAFKGKGGRGRVPTNILGDLNEKQNNSNGNNNNDNSNDNNNNNNEKIAICRTGEATYLTWVLGYGNFWYGKPSSFAVSR